MANKTSYQTKITLSALIFSIAFFGLIFFVIPPIIANVENIKIQTENQSLQLEKDFSQGKNLEKMNANLKIVEPRQNELKQIFIKKDNTNEIAFITALENVAEQSNVTEKADLGAETPLPSEQSYGQIPLELDLQGDFDSTLKFLSEIEKMPYYINIGSMQATTENIDSKITNKYASSTKILITQIYANTYWQN